jgi:hypothetical protein
MKIQSSFLRGVVIGTLVLLLNSFSNAAIQQTKPKISEAESKAVNAVETAADINAKMIAAEEFVKKYPKSNARAHVAEYIVDQILAVSDANQKMALAQKYPTIFTDPAEVDSIKPALIDSYVKLARFDEAFAEGATFLAKHPDNIQILIALSITGVEQAKARNAKFVDAARQYGAKAIELIEGDKKPAEMDAEVWTRQKTMLPQVYQEMAIISLMEQNATAAQAKLEKAAQLNPADPFNHMLLGSIINEEYQKTALTYKNMPDGKSKDDMLTKINAMLDKIIEHYARGVAMSEGKAQYQQFHDQLLQDLAAYYRYRHNSSTEGLQKLIDSYKTQP